MAIFRRVFVSLIVLCAPTLAAGPTKPAFKAPEVRLSLRVQVRGGWSHKLQAFDLTNLAGQSVSETASDQLTINAEGTYRKRLALGEVQQMRRDGVLNLDAAEKPYLRLFGGGGATLKREVRGRTTCDNKNKAVLDVSTGAATHTVKGDINGPGFSFSLINNEYSIGLSSAWLFWSNEQVQSKGTLQFKRQSCATETGSADWQVPSAQAVCMQTVAQAALSALNNGKGRWFSEIKGKFTPKSKTVFQASGHYSFDFLPPDKSEKNPFGDGQESVVESQDGQIALDYTLTYDADPVDIEAVITPPANYSQWIPEAGVDEDTPGNDIRFKVHLHDPQGGAVPVNTPATFRTAQFRVSLLGTTSEPGVCLNFPPKQNAKHTHDYRIEPSLLLKVDADGQSATSLAGLRDLPIVIKSYDWGGYTRLAVKAVFDNGKSVDAYVENQPTLIDASIPLDVNHNHVADKWEQSLRRDGAWDGDSYPSGQKTSGDAISYYEEYRGFMVLKNSKTQHIRTDPDGKDVFFIDEIGILDETLWEALSGIVPHRLNRQLIQGSDDINRESKIIDFNSGYGAAGHKYVITFVPDTSPGATFDEQHTFGNTGWLPETAPPAKQFALVRLFTTRYNNFIRDIWVKQELGRAAQTPNSDEMKKFLKAGIDPATVKAAWDETQHNPASVDRLLKKLWTLTALHEMGHSCRVEGHYGAIRKNAQGQNFQIEEPIGPRHCIMRYFSPDENRRVTVDEILGNPDVLPNEASEFCRIDFKCWEGFDVKDKD